MRKLITLIGLSFILLSCKQNADDQKEPGLKSIYTPVYYPAVANILGMEHLAELHNMDSVSLAFTSEGFKHIKSDNGFDRFIEGKYYTSQMDALTANLGMGTGFLSGLSFYQCLNDEGSFTISQTFPITKLAEFKMSLMNNMYSAVQQKLFFDENTKQQYVTENFKGILGRECSIWYKDSFATASLQVPKY